MRSLYPETKDIRAKRMLPVVKESDEHPEATGMLRTKEYLKVIKSVHIILHKMRIDSHEKGLFFISPAILDKMFV